jgi:polysaccharide pyruvyl transferase WcaK-like protein
MKIVVSGGWGYGNLGDDAILAATIGVLNRRYPGCEIVVLTYDLADSAIHRSSNVELRLCVHALVDNGSSEVLRPDIVHNYSRLRRKWMDLHFRLTETAWWFGLARRMADLGAVASALHGADLFVMGGGGYFNEKWLCKTRAQLQELALAHQFQVPVAVLGPTIGKFSGCLQAQVARELGRARWFTVRDPDSLADAQRVHGSVQIIPDIALSTWLPEGSVASQPLLGVVFNNQGAPLCGRLAEGVARFLASRPQWRVKLFVSRLWKYDVAAARGLQRALLAHGVSSEMVLASDFQALEQAMAASRLVVSENLHGLILAARNLVPVLAINDYPAGSPNDKKFKAFLAQSGAAHVFMNAQTPAEGVAGFLNELDQQRDARRQRLAKLRTRVEEAYAHVF